MACLHRRPHLCRRHPRPPRSQRSPHRSRRREPETPTIQIDPTGLTTSLQLCQKSTVSKAPASQATSFRNQRATSPESAVNRKQRGLSRPDTFAFLGFTFICSKSRRGFFQLQRKTRRDRLQAKLQEIKAELRLRMHQTIPDQGHWLKQVVTGHFAYYAVPTNSRALSAFRHYVTDLWRRTLRRRSQQDGFTWDRMTKLADDWLPAPRILHPWPDQRFAVKHPR